MKREEGIKKREEDFGKMEEVIKQRMEENKKREEECKNIVEECKKIEEHCRKREEDCKKRENDVNKLEEESKVRDTVSKKYGESFDGEFSGTRVLPHSKGRSRPQHTHQPQMFNPVSVQSAGKKRIKNVSILMS